ncbi:30S ribosomal protein S16 [bacterium]|nr:30S ribosomal protein S16 [bacterium]
MVKIRLKRFGTKKRPSYRIVVVDGRKKRDGKTIAEIGHYNPIEKKSFIDVEKANEWIKKGAQATERVEKLLASAKKEKGGSKDEGVSRVHSEVSG